MSFAEQLKTLNDAVLYRSLQLENNYEAVVKKRDLSDLIFHFNRIDSELRGYHDREVDLRAKCDKYKLKLEAEQQESLEGYADYQANLEAAELKITGLMEIIDSQKQTNLALVGKVEAVKAERNNFQNNGIEVAKQLINERDEAQRQVEKEISDSSFAITRLSSTCVQLQAQVAMLRGALIGLMDVIEAHQWECWQYELAGQTLSSTPSQQAERVQGLVEALEEVLKSDITSHGGRLETLMKQALAKYRGEVGE